jgi:hypothetical protein
LPNPSELQKAGRNKGQAGLNQPSIFLLARSVVPLVCEDVRRLPTASLAENGDGAMPGSPSRTLVVRNAEDFFEAITEINASSAPSQYTIVVAANSILTFDRSPPVLNNDNASVVIEAAGPLTWNGTSSLGVAAGSLQLDGVSVATVTAVTPQVFTVASISDLRAAIEFIDGAGGAQRIAGRLCRQAAQAASADQSSARCLRSGFAIRDAWGDR